MDFIILGDSAGGWHPTETDQLYESEVGKQFRSCPNERCGKNEQFMHNVLQTISYKGQCKFKNKKSICLANF